MPRLPRDHPPDPDRFGASGNPNGVRRAANREALEYRRREAVRLRVNGMPLTDVARTLGVGRTTVTQDIKIILAETNRGDIETQRKLENERLEFLWREVCEILDGAVDPEMRLKAVDRALRVAKRVAEMNGLDVPVRIDATVHVETEQDAAVKKLLEKVAARNQEIEGQIVGQVVTGDSDPTEAG